MCIKYGGTLFYFTTLRYSLDVSARMKQTQDILKLLSVYRLQVVSNWQQLRIISKRNRRCLNAVELLADNKLGAVGSAETFRAPLLLSKHV